jgi:hypothetical protein
MSFGSVEYVSAGKYANLSDFLLIRARLKKKLMLLEVADK